MKTTKLLTRDQVLLDQLLRAERKRLMDDINDLDDGQLLSESEDKLLASCKARLIRVNQLIIKVA